MYSPADTVANVVLALAAEFNRHEYVHTLHDSWLTSVSLSSQL